jgi:hypothetical protein
MLADFRTTIIRLAPTPDNGCPIPVRRSAGFRLSDIQFAHHISSCDVYFQPTSSHVIFHKFYNILYLLLSFNPSYLSSLPFKPAPLTGVRTQK